MDASGLDPKVLRKALSLLEAHDRFEAELRRELQKSGFDTELAEPVVSYLIERRFVDDRRTITNEIERNAGKRSMGRNLIRDRLLARGAPEELLNELLGDEPDGELERALGLLKGKYRTTDDRRKGGRLLYSKGFDESVIEQALERFFGSVDDCGE
jgi:SOS response regulatory protein OraA/RecX